MATKQQIVSIDLRLPRKVLRFYEQLAGDALVPVEQVLQVVIALAVHCDKPRDKRKK